VGDDEPHGDPPPCGVTADKGEAISLPGYRADGWCVAPARSTVMGALLGAGHFPDIEHSTNMRDLVDKGWFEAPWWFRTTFVTSGGGRTTLQLDGVIHKADLYVNGSPVASADDIAGAYTSNAFDVTKLVHPGSNALALRIHPGSPLEDLSIGWIDWNAWPPDNSMGVWRDVTVHRTGDLRVLTTQITSELDLPSLSEAALTVVGEVENLSIERKTAVVRGTVTGHRTEVAFEREVVVEGGARAEVRFAVEDTPALRIANPAVWWPVGEGDQSLYDLYVAVSVDGALSDQHSSTFGIRTVESHIEPGEGRRFVVNGRPLQVLSAGWSPDLFLRHDPRRTADELAYAVDIGLNSLRLEGKLENPEFFEMTDEIGLLVLPGWECCDKWEAERLAYGAKWTEEDYVIAGRSMAAEAVALRNHPSVIAFLIGSDFAPTPRIATLYWKELVAARWPLPVVSAARADPTEEAGPSGMKMTGPYAWVPPAYWYSTDQSRGGAVGFNSETGAGNNIPRLVNLRRMLGASELEALWREPEAKQFHAAPPSLFEDLTVFHAALSGRYGEPESLEDFVRKAHLANYEATRAQFEAVVSRAWADVPATGTVYWMFNSAWPSVNWQLYDWYLDPAAAYFGAKKALETVHVQFAYDRSAIEVVNRGGDEVAGPVTVVATVRDLTGAVVAEERHEIPVVSPRQTVHAGDAPSAESAGTTYFLALELLSPSGAITSRNVYWLSAQPDVLAWEDTVWRYTPCTQFADFMGLATMSTAKVEVGIEPAAEPGAAGAGTTTARLTLRNVSDGGTPAVAVHASIVAPAADGTASLPIAPLFWNDNDLTLFAGESQTLTVSYPTPAWGGRSDGDGGGGGGGGGLAVAIDGFNVEPFEVPL
jgi:exo-1,4-beta-D-glucosaminidase